MQTKPGEQPQSAFGPLSCGITGPLLVGAGHTTIPSRVTIDPGAVTVKVSGSIVTVVVKVREIPGSVNMRVVPSSVTVVGTPGSWVVTTEVTRNGQLICDNKASTTSITV